MTAPRGLVLVLLFLSGTAALVYEVLWLRELAILFGSDAQAAAITLSLFFAGMATGSALVGRVASRVRDPLGLFAGLEVGIALCALLYFVLLDAYAWLYPESVSLLGESDLATLVVKAVLAFVILFPAAFLMGGSLPAIVESIVREPRELGRTTAALYAANTAGGAFGALAAGFWLPPRLGIQRSYLLAIFLNVAVAGAAFALARPRSVAMNRPTREDAASPPALAAGSIRGLAFVTGFIALALEVLWTRSFALVLHNSVYSFAAILVVFLISIALGAVLAVRLCRARLEPALVLFLLLLGAGISAGLSPFLLHAITGRLGSLAIDGGWPLYVAGVFRNVFLVALVPGMLCGCVLPYLVRVSEGPDARPGETVGGLVFANTLGGAIGALVAGFVLLPWMGLWGSVRAMALVLLLLALTATVRLRAARFLRLAAGTAIVLFSTLLDPSDLLLVRLDANESLERVWETRLGVVAVTEAPGDRRIRVDNSYILGGTRSDAYEKTQANLPLMVHASPKSVFFLGLGTGITASAALEHPVERVTTVELLPEVIEASREYFPEYTTPLFSDPRSRVVAGDGRSFLGATPERYDVIVSDLFIPWQAGTGSLYTKEHFETARQRLAPGGLFAQWLPLYQLTRHDFDVIVRTFLEVFPQVTLWRGDFFTREPIVALVGQEADARYRPEKMLAYLRALGRYANDDDDVVSSLIALHYIGNLTAARALFANASVNGDDLPVLEYGAPISQARARSGEVDWLTLQALASLQSELAGAAHATSDPYLADAGQETKDWVLAGTILQRALVARELGQVALANELRLELQKLVPPAVYRRFEDRLGGDPSDVASAS